jgi:hypothetical protein
MSRRIRNRRGAGALRGGTLPGELAQVIEGDAQSAGEIGFDAAGSLQEGKNSGGSDILVSPRETPFGGGVARDWYIRQQFLITHVLARRKPSWISKLCRQRSFSP